MSHMTLIPKLSNLRLLAAVAIASLGLARESLAVNYTFLNVNQTGATTSQFVSTQTGATINVTHSFSAGGAGASDNINTAIFPSQFTNTFPGSGQVKGHLAQTVYNHTSVVRFSLLNYNITPATIFGMWNTTDEVTRPVGGPPVYQLQLVNAGGSQVNPTSLQVYGRQDNQTQVQGRHELDLNTATGEISPGQVINGGIGTHTSATFWNNIPAGTQEIVVFGNLPALNNIGDGVGYYFAEPVVPEPTSLATLSALAVGLRRRR